MMAGAINAGNGGRAERFKTLALPHLDDAYTLARYLMRSASDAEDAVQECYLRAFRHFDTFRGGPIKPWLMAILRNVCHASRTGSARLEFTADSDEPQFRHCGASPPTRLSRRCCAGRTPTPCAG